MPEKRDKTKLEDSEQKGKDDSREEQPKSEADPDTWDKLKKKPKQPEDDPKGIKLGKGKKPGKARQIH